MKNIMQDIDEICDVFICSSLLYSDSHEVVKLLLNWDEKHLEFYVDDWVSHIETHLSNLGDMQVEALECRTEVTQKLIIVECKQSKHN